jgi:linearmycin/streptolysin S transport system permease protein
VRVALVVAGKELRQRLRDRTAILLGFVAPSILAAIVTGAFGSGFGPASSNIHFTAAVADADRSQLSQAFTEQVLRSPQLRKLLTVRKVSGPQAAKDIVRRGMPAAFVIPKGFQADVASGRRAAIRVLRNASTPIIGDIAEAIGTAYTEQVNASRLSIFTAIRAGPNPSALAELTQDAARARMPVRLVDQGVATRKVSGANYFGPGMAIFFLFFIVGTGARSLLAEREQGTMPRILAAPGPRSSILIGKGLAVFAIAIASMITMYVVMGVVFGVRWGDPLAVGAITLFIVLALMSVTTLVQTLAKTEIQAASYGSMVGTIFALVGGNFFPLFQMPAFIQRLSALTPNGWALRGFTDIAYDGAKLGDLVPHLAAMAAFVVVCGSVGLMRARKIALS